MEAPSCTIGKWQIATHADLRRALQCHLNLVLVLHTSMVIWFFLDNEFAGWQPVTAVAPFVVGISVILDYAGTASHLCIAVVRRRSAAPRKPAPRESAATGGDERHEHFRLAGQTSRPSARLPKAVHLLFSFSRLTQVSIRGTAPATVTAQRKAGFRVSVTLNCPTSPIHAESTQHHDLREGDTAKLLTKAK